MFRRLLVLATVAAALGACTKDNPAFVEPEGACDAGEFYVRQEFRLADPQKLDVLFVIDNTEGMTQAQTAFAESVPTLIAGLQARGIDWQIGVISTDLPGDRGELLTGIPGIAQCPVGRPAIVTPTTPQPALSAACNMVVGADGEPFAAGIQAARVAIDDDGSGFNRDDARLLVIFFSADDDCSYAGGFDRSDEANCVAPGAALIDIAELRTWLAQRGRPRAGNPVSVAAVVGPARNGTPGDPLAPICTGITDARAGNRYAALIESGPLARHSITASYCTDSYDVVMQQILDATVAGDDSLCASAPMTGEPRAVLVRGAGEDATPTDLSPFGDYLVEGPTPSCANGAVSIAPDAHGGTAGDTVEVWFCTDVDPGGT